MMEGDSVTLHTDREMRNNDLILWRFGPENILIAEINVVDSSMTVNEDYDGRFIGRMKVDRQTGCLTIRNTRIEHAGRYELQTNTMKKFFILTVYYGELNISFICCVHVFVWDIILYFSEFSTI